MVKQQNNTVIIAAKMNEGDYITLLNTLTNAIANEKSQEGRSALAIFLKELLPTENQIYLHEN
ncbi:MAG: hypothetical protein JSR11_03725 [Bacteroidetes bacterium]|nr:hypothetical protein [Bacteroidota bacterium]